MAAIRKFSVQRTIRTTPVVDSTVRKNLERARLRRLRVGPGPDPTYVRGAG